MSRRWESQTQGVGKFPVRSAVATLDGTTHVELIPAPPADVSYHVFFINGENQDATSQSLEVYGNKNGTRTLLWVSASRAQNTCWSTNVADSNTATFDIVLGSTDESLDIRVGTAGTSHVWAAYRVEEK